MACLQTADIQSHDTLLPICVEHDWGTPWCYLGNPTVIGPWRTFVATNNWLESDTVHSEDFVSDDK